MNTSSPHAHPCTGGIAPAGERPSLPPRIKKFVDLGQALRCPLCGGDLAVQDASLRCGRGHCFDIASKGYANLLAHASATSGYDNAFFESRERIFAAGLYGHVLAAVLKAARSEMGAADGPLGTGAILDVGCGEGYYAKAVLATLSRPVIGLDNARDAIQRAARGGGGVCWLVSDLANLPVRDGAASCLLNIFTPANYAEFRRALTPGGVLIKVVPGPRHLIELRELAKDRLRHRTHSNERVVEHFERHMPLDARLRVTETFPVAPELARDLFGMTPLFFHVDTSSLDPAAVDCVTIDAELLIGHNR